MLNKNQSKKRNSWKLYVVIPALAVFVLLFQIEVIAKEKIEITSNELRDKDGSVDVYKISKTTTDQQLKEMVEKMKLNHGVDAEISDVERNSNKELTAIRFDLKRGSEQAQSYHVKGSTAIKDCQIVIETGKDGSKKIGLKTENENGEVKVTKDQVKVTNKEHKVEVKKVTNSKINCDVKTTNNTHGNINTSNSENTTVIVNTDVNGNTKSNITISSASQPNVKIGFNKLIIVDGEVVSPGLTTADLESLNIKTMHVLTGVNALAKYGDQGSNGVIEIETKK